MDIFRRIGTQKKKFKVQFFIGRLKFSSFKAGKVYIVIKRGDKKAKSQQKLQMSDDNKLNFNKQILQVQVTLFFDQKQNKYQQKPGQLNVVLLDEKQNKVLLGMVPFDVAQYANSGQQSIKQKKKLQQTPKKLEGLIEYNVFVKYIGQGSQSSVDKIGDFFFGKSKQQTQASKKVAKQKQAQTKKKKKKNSSQEKQSSPRQEIPSKKDKKKSKDKQKQKSLNKTQFKKGKQKDQPKIDNKLPKNYVTAGKNTTQNAYLTSDNDDQNGKNTFYFDQPQTDKQGQKNTKNKKKSNSMQKPKKLLKQQQISKKQTGKKNSKKQQESSEQGSQPEQDVQTSEVQPVNSNTMFKKFYQAPGSGSDKVKPNSQKKIPIQTLSTQANKSKKVEKSVENQQITDKKFDKKGYNKDDPKANQNLIQQNQSLKSRLKQSQLSNSNLKNQISNYQNQINQLKQQVQYYQAQIKQKQQQLLKQRNTISNIQSNMNEFQNQKGSIQYYQVQLKKMQKQKNQLIVQNSRLKQKYRQQIKQFKQALSQKQEKQVQLNQTGRAQIQRLKQECSSFRQKIQKLTKEKDDKTSQLNKQKNQNKNLQLQVTQLKTSLSKIKLKICNLLNDALAKNQDYTIELLMELNKD